MEELSSKVDLTSPSKLDPHYSLHIKTKPHCSKSKRRKDIFGNVYWECRHENKLKEKD